MSGHAPTADAFDEAFERGSILVGAHEQYPVWKIFRRGRRSWPQDLRDSDADRSHTAFPIGEEGRVFPIPDKEPPWFNPCVSFDA